MHGYYYSEVGRFIEVDPKWDKYPGWSPYVYCRDNPVIRIDPDGKADIIVVEVREPSNYPLESKILVYNDGTVGDIKIYGKTYEEIIRLLGKLLKIFNLASSRPDKGAGPTLAEGSADYRITKMGKSGTRALLLNNGGELRTIDPNKEHGGRKVATEIFIHGIRLDYNITRRKGSKGCITVVPFGGDEGLF